MTITILNESNVDKYYWAEGINTSCYILNRVSVRIFLNRPCMNSEKEESQTFLIFISLDFILHFKQQRQLGKV